MFGALLSPRPSQNRDYKIESLFTLFHSKRLTVPESNRPRTAPGAAASRPWRSAVSTGRRHWVALGARLGWVTPEQPPNKHQISDLGATSPYYIQSLQSQRKFFVCLHLARWPLIFQQTNVLSPFSKFPLFATLNLYQLLWCKHNCALIYTIHCILYSVYSTLLPALYIQYVITSRWPKVCVVQLSATCNLSPTATNKYDAEQDWSCTRAATQQHSPLLRSLAGAICDDMYSCTPAELSRCANQPTQVSDRL